MGEISACVVWRQTLYKFRSRVKYCEILPNITSCHSTVSCFFIWRYVINCCSTELRHTKRLNHLNVCECLRLCLGQFCHYQWVSQKEIFKNHKNLKVLIHLKKLIIFINFGFIGTSSSLSNELLYDHKNLIISLSFWYHYVPL